MRRYLIAFLFLCIASVCYANPEIIHIKHKTPAAGGGCTPATIAHRTGSPYAGAVPSTSIGSIAVTAGDLIAVIYSYDDNVASTTCSDNSGGGSNTYTVAGEIHQGKVAPYSENIDLYIFKAVAKATETLTITCTTRSYPNISVHVYNPGGSTISQDGSATTLAEGSNSTSHTGPNIDVSGGVTSAVVVAAVAQEDATSSASAWTNSFTERLDISGQVVHSADRFVTTSGTYATGFTSSATEAYVWVMAVFKATCP